MSDRAIGVALLVFCAVMWAQTYAIKTPPFAQFQQLDSPFFPRLVIIALAAFSALLALRGQGRLLPSGGAAAVARVVRDNARVLASLAMFVMYVVAMPLAGYVPTTAVYLAAMQLLLRRRGPVGTAAVLVVSAISAYLIALVFTTYLHVVLPRGEL